MGVRDGVGSRRLGAGHRRAALAGNAAQHRCRGPDANAAAPSLRRVYEGARLRALFRGYLKLNAGEAFYPTLQVGGGVGWPRVEEGSVLVHGCRFTLHGKAGPSF